MANSFTPDSLNPAILNVQYAVRGELAIKAEEYRDRLREHPNDHGLPFDKVINANIGNPQQAGLDQKPLTFGRQVRRFWMFACVVPYARIRPIVVYRSLRYWNTLR